MGGEGRDEFENWAQLGRVTWHSLGSVGDGSSSFGPGVGPMGLKWDFGPTLQGPSLSRGAELVTTGPECGPSEDGPLKGWSSCLMGLLLCLGAV